MVGGSSSEPVRRYELNRLTVTPVAAAGIICIAIFLISTPISVNATTYIGLYADEVHSECSWYGEYIVAVEASSWGAIKSLMK